MPSLRKRTSRPNYAALADIEGLEDEDEPSAAEPFNITGPQEEDDASGSDFAPDQPDGDEDAEGEDEIEEVPDDVENGDAFEDMPSDNDEFPEVGTPDNARVMRASKKRKKPIPKGVTIPNVHHRHRAIPIFHREDQIERLGKRPRLFGEPEIVPTNSWSFNDGITNNRVSKALGFNVGPGPLWELLEDRAWFKESFDHIDQMDEAYRRPRVHEDVQIPIGWEILSGEQAAEYLPTNSDTDKTSSPISCSFGKYGQQSRVALKTFDSVKLSTYLPGSTSHVFNAGASVWGLDWCPIYPDDREAHSYRKYLAVAPFPTKSHTSLVGARTERPANACIQIWTWSPTELSDTERSAVDEGREEDPGIMRCELVFCIESGAARELKWCPLPSNDSPDGTVSGPQKLGILAGTFEDGSVSLYAVPDPADIRSKVKATPSSGPVFVRLTTPLLRMELEDTTAWCFDWANSETLAVGCANGWVAVYDVGSALRTSDKQIIPTHYFPVHQSAVKVISWVRAPTTSATGEITADNPTVIATGGYDGLACLRDIRENTAVDLNRTRDTVNSMNFSTFYAGPVTTDQENTVKAYSLAPIMLGRGHKFIEPNGPVLNVHSCDYHPQIAVGVTDGSCLTTNIMRTTRRGSNVAFWEHKIFQLSYSRKRDEYAMLENFLPRETQDRPTLTKANKTMPIGTGAWPTEVGVQRVVWNSGNGLAGAPLLASATGSGLCRVDCVLGRWYRDRVPYVSVEQMRQEVDGDDAMEEDSD
ncbi:hypothetical protein BXZ70DRAFT_915612 [Cristinia sonorae]|uniref:Uncharacterized protein n=1 Tax=Cristinia sonorae TaxID=1940300 RepID=A0A8K0XU40_9AGAR|nr:hypothetical protein BXZ70DRAFT_915612 [Cristinia sonorae]